MSQIQILPAKPEDMPTLLEFIRALAHYEKLEDQVVATEEKLRTSLFGNPPAAEVLFIEKDGVKVGFALFFSSYSTFLAQKGIYLEDLFILPACRGQGLGKRLLAALASLAVQRQCGRLEWSVLDWNEPALQFYQKLDAEPMDQWTVHRLTGENLLRLAQSFGCP